MRVGALVADAEWGLLRLKRVGVFGVYTCCVPSQVHDLCRQEQSIWRALVRVSAGHNLRPS